MAVFAHQAEKRHTRISDERQIENHRRQKKKLNSNLMAASQQVQQLRRRIDILKSKIKCESTVMDAESIMKEHEELERELKDNSLLSALLRECEEGNEFWQTDCEYLFETVISYKDLVHELIDIMERLQHNLSCTESELKRLKITCETLETKVKKLECDRLKLMACQLAFEIHQAIIHKILSGIINIEEKQINTIGEMEKAIAGSKGCEDVFDKDSDRDMANTRWLTLQRDLQWKKVHYRYLQNLKRLRVNIAHPEFDPQAITDALSKGTLEGIQDLKLYKECLQMYKKLK